MAARALYGPTNWPRGRPRDDTTPLVSGAALVEARKHGLVNRGFSSNVERFPIVPWLKTNGIEQHTMSRLGVYGDTVERCVRQLSQAKLESDNAARVLGHQKAGFISFVEATRAALAKGQVPHGAVEYVQWWSQYCGTGYYEGRRPMARMPNLPEDALRLVYEYFVPLERDDATAELSSAQELLEGPRADSDEEDADVAVPPPRPGAGTMMLVEGDLASESDGDASSYDGGSDDDDEDDDSGSAEDLGETDDEEDLDELNERYGELGEVYGALEDVDATLFRRFYDTRGLVSLNSHFRTALQRTVKMHRQRHQQYEDVMHRLDEYRSHVDRLRRDRGYESEHHHDG